MRDFLPAVPESVGMDSTRLDRLGELLQGMVDDGKLPFARIKVCKAGKLVYDFTANGPCGTITEDSLYRYYSQTKIVATMVTLIAMERGLLRLDDPVGVHTSGNPYIF